MAWMLHHVNVPALNVRATKAFLRDIIGLKEGDWIYPDLPGELHHDEDSIAYFGTANQGLHVVRSIVSFAKDNGFLHNPTIGGHFAISVPDLDAVKSRLDDAAVPYSDAGVYAMAGVHQIYCYDPSFNVIEVNQTVTPLPSATLELQDQAADVHLRQVAIPAHDIGQSAAFFRDLIGLGDGASAGDHDGAIFRSGDHAIRLTRLASSFANRCASGPGGQEPYFTLAVPGLDAVNQRLDRARIPYSGIVREPIDGVDSLFVHDPSMRLMAVVQA